MAAAGKLAATPLVERASIDDGWQDSTEGDGERDDEGDTECDAAGPAGACQTHPCVVSAAKPTHVSCQRVGYIRTWHQGMLQTPRAACESRT